MKSALLMTMAGVSLFSTTVVGLLAIQGRLNFDGTRGMPILESFFAEPPDSGDDPHGAETDPHAPDPHELVEPDPRVGGLGREEALPHHVGPSLGEVDASAGGPPVGRKQTTDTGETDGHGQAAGDGHGSAPNQFKGRVKSLMGQDQYRRGQLFRFPHLDSGMSVAELDELAASVQQRTLELERREAALEQRATGLGAREADIEERERAVLHKMREVLQERGKLEEEIAQFQKTYTLVRTNEMARYKTYADQLASLNADQSSKIILRKWETEEGKIDAVKILKLMPKEATDEIMGTLSAEQAQDILDLLSATVVEESKK